MAERSLCPQTEPFRIRGEPFSASEILCVLEEYISEERKQRIREVVAQRTYSVVPVLEGLYDFGNVNAVLRSAEAMGCQAAHVIDLVTNRIDDASRKRGWRLVGDADFPALKEVCSWITPVPGGVGPMTRAMLLVNTVRAAGG